MKVKGTLTYQHMYQEHTIDNIFAERNYYLIGRSSSNDNTVPEQATSRQHAMLLACKGKCYIISYARNGTFYNPLRCEFSKQDELASVSGESFMSFQKKYLQKNANAAELSHLEAKQEQKQVEVANIIGFTPGAFKTLDDIQYLIDMALDPTDIDYLAAMGREVKHLSYIGVGGHLGNGRKYFVELDIS